MLKKEFINKGRPLTKEHVQKLKEAHADFSGKNNPFYGKKHSEETKAKLSKIHKGILSGKNHPNWRGGKTIKYPPDWNKSFKENIRARDKYKCQLCGVNEKECTRKLHVHHIDYNKFNLDSRNLISLCIGCHNKTTWNREYYMEYFKCF